MHSSHDSELTSSKANLKAGSLAALDILRIVFEIVEHEAAEAILLVSVGTHEEVY
jgi:hypothetical protein